MLRGVALSVLAGCAATCCWGASLASAVPTAATSGRPTVLGSYAPVSTAVVADRDPITGFDAGYGVVAWSALVRKGRTLTSQIHVRLASGKVKTLPPGLGDVLTVVRVNGPSGPAGVRVIVQRCTVVDCARTALDPSSGNAWTPTAPWIEQLIGDGGSVTTGASTVQDGTALTVEPATGGSSTCATLAFTLDDTTRQGDLPPVPECVVPSWVQMRGSLIVTRTSMPTLVPGHLRWQSMVLDTAAPVPAWSRIALAVQDPTGGTFVKREAIGPGWVVTLQEPFRSNPRTGVVTDVAARKLFQTTLPAASPYAPSAPPAPVLVPFGVTQRSPLLAVRTDGSHLFVSREHHAAGARLPDAFQVLELPH